MGLAHLWAFLLCLAGVLASHTWDDRTPLDEYIAKDDGYYNYTILNITAEEDYTVYIINMTSQKWYTEEDSTQSIWWHWMTITIPREIRNPEHGFLMVVGGSNRGSPPAADDVTAVAAGTFSNSTGMCGGVIRMVPNQPITFLDDPFLLRRTEDSIIAYTWRKYIEANRSPDFLLQFPQTKSAVKGMDTIAAVAKTHRPEINVNKFFIAGASKRGWTSWLAAATDRRVVGVFPLVLSCLNFQENLMHHYRSMGNWSHAFRSYYNENITKYLTHPKTAEMANIIDPYAYRARLTMPKIIISATGDEFFLVDDSHYFFDQLPEPKYMMLLEDSNHGLFPHYLRIFEGVVGFVKAVVSDFPLPQMRWMRNETADAGTITLYTDTVPSVITSYMTTTLEGETPRRRDFRLTWLNNGTVDLHPVYWEEFPVEIVDDGEYRIEHLKVDGRWRAMFIQAEFPGPDGETLDLTTEVNIIPDVMPYPRCSGDACLGTLV